MLNKTEIDGKPGQRTFCAVWGNHIALYDIKVDQFDGEDDFELGRNLKREYLAMSVNGGHPRDYYVPSSKTNIETYSREAFYK